MDKHSPEIELDEESYETKAIKAYLRGKIQAKDLLASLEVSRPVMYRMIKRFEPPRDYRAYPKHSKPIAQSLTSPLRRSTTS